MATSVDPHWLTLCLHFVHHARQVDRFRTASELAVRCMWDNQINEDGEPLTPFGHLSVKLSSNVIVNYSECGRSSRHSSVSCHHRLSQGLAIS
jgi:hypothetical protein